MADRDALREPISRSVLAFRPEVHPGAEAASRPWVTPVSMGPGLRRDPLPSPAERTVEQYPVSRAKVMPPPLHETTLSRDRLLDWLERHVHRRCITVVAETGFGKTTLLADFTRRASVRCLWYRLDTGDRDPISFVNYVVAAVRETLPAFGTRTLALLGSMLTARPSTELIVATLLSELAALADRSTVLILDDYHVVDQDPRARALVTRLLAEAPDRMTFVLLSRRPPRLPIGRLIARGEAPRLGADDLRFSVDETERLFRDVYRQPLETEVLREVEERTDGWAAGLQLLHSSIRGRSPRDVRAFVRALTGAEGPLYDYLAEEVMSDLASEVQRFLTYTAILDDVRLELAAAIFGADDPPPSTEQIEAWAEVGRQAGLMARHSALSSSRRYHPLMREFLERRLELLVTRDELRGMHLRVARAAEATDWLASCRHYIKADHEKDALRVLVANAAKVLGSGQWGDGADLIRTLHASDEDPRIAVILAREDVYGDRLEQGLGRVQRFDLGALDGATRGLVVQARVHALWWLGRVSDIRPLVREAISDPQIPEHSRGVLIGTDALLHALRDGPLPPVAHALEELAGGQETRDGPFAAAITQHNLLHVYLCQGDLARALETGYRALELFAKIKDEPDEVGSTHIGLGRVLVELGRWADARSEINAGLRSRGIGMRERLLEAAGLLAQLGDAGHARELIQQVQGSGGDLDARTAFQWRLNAAQVALASGAVDDCIRLLDAPLESLEVTDLSGWVQWLFVQASAWLAAHSPRQAATAIARGRLLIEQQGAWLYRTRFRILASLADSGREIDTVFAEASERDILAAAEAIAAQLHLIDSVQRKVKATVENRPDRWLPLLRQVIADPTGPAAAPAAALLDEYGELTDVRLLRRLAKSRIKAFRGSDIGRGLARRRSPHLTVHDLGRAYFEVGPRRVELSSIRRRSAGLLCFLLTRKNHLAPRDQVLEALWPDVDPQAAVNSLNQTLYFLRRDFDPEYDDDCSAQYVHFESDLVWLDRELVSAESAAFQERASRALSALEDLDEGIAALSVYRGRFAPEFEYEDWATAWRELLHGQYLHLAETFVGRLIQSDRMVDAADLAVRVLQVDAGAEHLERELIWLYGTLGARSAAAEQYGHYAEVQRTEYGVEPPSLEEIISCR